jgi:hypothetical protein
MAVKFRNGMIIRVTDHGGRSDMNGLIGSVVRIKSDGRSAWIKSYTPLTDKQRSFPLGDPRQDHFDIYDDECEAVHNESLR